MLLDINLLYRLFDGVYFSWLQINLGNNKIERKEPSPDIVRTVLHIYDPVSFSFRWPGPLHFLVCPFESSYVFLKLSLALFLSDSSERRGANKWLLPQ